MTDKTNKTRLSEHFSKEEMTYSRIAVDNGLDNEPSPDALHALGYLATRLLEPLRGLYNGPIAVLSGYRSAAVNLLAGCVGNSQHLKGEAADCYIPEGPGRLLEILLKSGLTFDQAIIYKKRRFLHLSLKEKGDNRMQVLFCMVLCLFLFSGCGTKKHSYKSETVGTAISSKKDSSHVTESVQRVITELIECKGTAVITVTELSKPDSIGNQYIVKTTQADVHSGQKRSVTTEDNSDKQEIETSVKAKDE